jgi:hypothetical protein
MIRNTRRATALSLVLASVLLLACEGERITGSPPTVVDARPFVTGTAAEALRADGLFRLPEPLAPASTPIVSPDRARALAASYLLSVGHSLKSYWEQERGQRIDLASLDVDSRVFFASTPYRPFPEGFHPAFAHAFGPYYLTMLKSGSTPVLRIAVAAYSTEVTINAEGKFERPVQRGNEFVSQGISADTARPNLAAFVTPEAAVVLAGHLTGVRVSETPQLMRVGLPLGPFSSVWKLTMERPVRVRTKNGARTAEVRHLFVGSEQGRRLMIPAADQPTEYRMLAFRVTPTGEDLPPEMVPVSILPDHATVFEEVVVMSGA